MATHGYTSHRATLCNHADPKDFPQRDSESPEAQITTSIHALNTAVNTRNFDPSSSTWQQIMTPDAVLEPTFAGWPQRSCLAEFLSLFQAHTSRHPEHFLRIIDIHVTITHTTGRANAFVNFKSNGIPTGVVRDSVGSFDFLEIKGRWLCERYKCLPGIATVGAFTER